MTQDREVSLTWEGTVTSDEEFSSNNNSNNRLRYIYNGQDFHKVKNLSKNNINRYESNLKSAPANKYRKKILKFGQNGKKSRLWKIDVKHTPMIQSLMESSYTRQIVADFLELDKCYYRDGLI